ncbi:DNA-3-methyladenine glycosylase family protein [Litchfieldia alkalitelluris]|uniref:DNA-3-methyladenine glycosylase II n=2 Tax=Evansella alkalicola TaxID=745819 RepID=A0ABS6JWC9_9BACI|nr:DNA-3-methyladenine glycosylase [Litchfieldia alkalitelluris]MBU9722869.1 DNA-3-methyladenine glycosylase [Bacillus alkalicola]
MDKELLLEGPYNFFQGLKRLAIDPIIVMNMEEQMLKVPIQVEGKNEVVEVSQLGTVENPKFRITGGDSIDEAIVMKRLTEIFHWDIPLQKIYEHLDKTELSSLIQPFRGTPFICDFSMYGCLMKTIIHQQLNMTFAYRLTERFIKAFGAEKNGVWFYPSPDKVSKLMVDDLRELQFSQRKAEYVIDTSKLISEGLLDLEKMREASNDEVMEQLLPIRGVGRWTVECFLMFGLGRLDLFPVQDIGIQNGLKKYYKLDKKPSHEDMLEWAEAWKPYRTYASLYIWESIEVD